MNAGRGPERMRIIDTLLLAVLFAALLAWPIGSPPIDRHGEAREGLVVRDIVEQGHWVLPRRNGELPSKPPLFHWIAALTARAFGLSDATVRLPSALAAWAAAAAVLTFGSVTGSRLTGWLAAGALLGMQPFWEAAARARVDMLFAACITIALVAFFLWYRDGGRGARITCYIGTAAAVLTKGPAGAFLVGVAILVFLLAQRDLRRLGTLWSWPPVVLALALSAGWYAAAYRAGGREFIELQLLTENVDRALGTGSFQGAWSRVPLRMEVTLLTQLLPWNLCLLWAVVRWRRGDRENAAGRFLHVWWLTILGVFTAAASKRGAYLLPLYPAIALLAARALVRALDSPRLARSIPACLRRLYPTRPVVGVVAAAVILVGLSVGLVNQVVRERRARQRSLLPFSREVARHIAPDTPLYAVPGLPHGDLLTLAYELDRPIPRRRVNCERPAYYLIPASRTGRFAAGPYEIIGSLRRAHHDVALLRCRTPA